MAEKIRKFGKKYALRKSCEFNKKMGKRKKKS